MRRILFELENWYVSSIGGIFVVFSSHSNIKTASPHIANNCFKWINPRLVWSGLFWALDRNCKILKTSDCWVCVIRLTTIAETLYQPELAQSLLKVKIANLRLWKRDKDPEKNQIGSCVCKHEVWNFQKKIKFTFPALTHVNASRTHARKRVQCEKCFGKSYAINFDLN